MTQPTYAPELEILGAAVGGTSFVNIFNSKILYINKGPIAGFIPTILTGLGAQHPQVHQVVQKQLKPEQRELFKKVLDQCFEANKATFAGLDIVGMFYDFDPVKKALERAAWAERFETSTPPKTPILWLESEEDQIFPVRNAEKEVDRYCRRGARIHFLRHRERLQPRNVRNPGVGGVHILQLAGRTRCR